MKELSIISILVLINLKETFKMSKIRQEALKVDLEILNLI